MTAMSFCALDTSMVKAQSATLTNGPELENDRDNKMNRMIDGDANSFYCYRVRSKGKGTSFFVEKYDKKTLKAAFSKEIQFVDDRAKVEDVRYANNNVYVFSRWYDKEGDKMKVYYQTVSSTGVASPKPTEITFVKSDHYEFVDIDISENDAHTKFLAKISHKPSKDGKYTTDFILINIDGMKVESKKSVDGKLFSQSEGMMGGGFGSMMFGGFANMFRNDLGCLGVKLDDKGDIYYVALEDAKSATEKEKRYMLRLGYFASASTSPKIIDLTFDDNYWVKDIEFSKTKTGEIVVGGFLKDVIERRGRDLVKVGIFSFTVDAPSGKTLAHPVRMFDDKLLTALESSAKVMISSTNRGDSSPDIGCRLWGSCK